MWLQTCRRRGSMVRWREWPAPPSRPRTDRPPPPGRATSSPQTGRTTGTSPSLALLSVKHIIVVLIELAFTKLKEIFSCLMCLNLTKSNITTFTKRHDSRNIASIDALFCDTIKIFLLYLCRLFYYFRTTSLHSPFCEILCSFYFTCALKKNIKHLNTKLSYLY